MIDRLRIRAFCEQRSSYVGCHTRPCSHSIGLPINCSCAVPQALMTWTTQCERWSEN